MAFTWASTGSTCSSSEVAVALSDAAFSWSEMGDGEDVRASECLPVLAPRHEHHEDVEVRLDRAVGEVDEAGGPGEEAEAGRHAGDAPILGDPGDPNQSADEGDICADGDDPEAVHQADADQQRDVELQDQRHHPMASCELFIRQVRTGRQSVSYTHLTLPTICSV